MTRDAAIRRQQYAARLAREQRGACAMCPAKLVGLGDRGRVFGRIDARLCRSCRISQDRRDAAIERALAPRRAA